MIKILKVGKIPESDLYKITCKYCETLFEYTINETKSIHTITSRNVYYEQYIKCPLCEKKLKVK